MKIFAFTLLRNGIKYDYPYRESLQCLCDLSEKVYLALGKSEDGTEHSLASYRNLEILPTVWDENLRKSGLILSQQTNLALNALRKQEKDGWALYLQADEIFDDAEFELLKQDLNKAQAQGCDAIFFRYLHFWRTFDQIGFQKRWYPQEIRAVRLGNPAIESFGDAQGFRGQKKVFYSDVSVFHYGHVREESAYKNKLKDFNRWWHSDEEMPRILAKGKRRDPHEITLRYLGHHPSYMKARRVSLGDTTLAVATSFKKVLVYGSSKDISSSFLKAIPVEVSFTTSLLPLLRAGKDTAVVILDPLPRVFQPLRFVFRSRVPRKMKSPQARPWPKEFLLQLKLSELGIQAKYD